ncbi:MAG: DUF2808 domain-containing protein [Sphaerospermopsis sp. SIO1G2]|nr:DUF2808 domain-containing protein [Sphaerospermopsis sp. SIO1G1]NET71965.1 DUF2808 domain-containing protein [Sphaerospermopsis sp. SIO1G2]
MRRLISALAVTGCLMTSFPSIVLANQGFTLWSGVKRENQLPAHMQFGGNRYSTDRYVLTIPAKKMKLAVAQFAITYPEYYDGTFDENKIEVRVKGKSLPLSEVKWNKAGNIIEIFPEEPVPAGNTVELVFSNVQNPPFGGMYYFNCQILSPGDLPLLRYLGSWVLSID